MLLSGGRFDGGDHLAVHAQLRKAAEGSVFLPVIIPHRFIQADHAFLDDILAVCADQEIGSGFGTHQRFILIQQIFLGRIITVLGHQRQCFVFCILIVLFFRHYHFLLRAFISAGAGSQTTPVLPRPDDPPIYYSSAVCFR